MKQLSVLALACFKDPFNRVSMYKDVFKKYPKSRELVKQLHDRVDRAVKFTLDDDYVRYATEISLLDLPVMSYLVDRARAPYSCMWVEWDEITRIKALSEKTQRIRSDGDEPARLGALIEKFPETPGDDTNYRVTIVGGMEGPKKSHVGVMPVSWVYNTEEAINHRNYLQPRISDPVQLMIDGGFRDRLVPGYVGLGPWYVDGLVKKNKNIPEVAIDIRRILSHFNWDWSNYMGRLFIDMIEENYRGQAKEIIATVISEQNGLLRYIMAIIGLINACTVDIIDTRVPRKHGVPIDPINPDSFIEFNTLTITAPHENPIKTFVRLADETYNKKRAHLVMGHWCTSHSTGKRWWRSEHRRGDPALGFVHKDYVVEKDNTAPKKKSDGNGRPK